MSWTNPELNSGVEEYVTEVCRRVWLWDDRTEPRAYELYDKGLTVIEAATKIKKEIEEKEAEYGE